jgi:hypothetical protein
MAFYLYLIKIGDIMKLSRMQLRQLIQEAIRLQEKSLDGAIRFGDENQNFMVPGYRDRPSMTRYHVKADKGAILSLDTFDVIEGGTIIIVLKDENEVEKKVEKIPKPAKSTEFDYVWPGGAFVVELSSQLG